MSDISGILDSLYRNDTPATSLEKTAAERMAEALAPSPDVVSENPYESMSTEDLAALALSLESQSDSAESVVGDLSLEDQEKIAQNNRIGRVMAHATVDEFNRIKVAMVNGLCRVCKENARDIPGASICSECTPQGE